MIEKVKAKLEATLIDGSTLDELLNFEAQQDKILKLINNVGFNLELFEIKFISPETNLAQTNNIVEISIEYNCRSSYAKVKFKDVQSYSEKMINELISNAENEINNNIIKLEKLMLISESKRGMVAHIKSTINDERITVEVLNLSKIAQEDKLEVIIEIGVNHRIFVNNLKKLNFEFSDEEKYRKDWWYNESDNSNPDSKQSNNDHQSNKPDKNKLNDIANATIHSLVGLSSDCEIGSQKFGANLRLTRLGFHPNKNKTFFKNWYKKVKNEKPEGSFNEIYIVLSFKIFKILEDDMKEVETILENLDSYDDKLLTENKVINRFCKYLESALIDINDKVKFEKEKSEK